MAAFISNVRPILTSNLQKSSAFISPYRIQTSPCITVRQRRTRAVRSTITASASLAANNGSSGGDDPAQIPVSKPAVFREILEGLYQLALPLWTGKQKSIAWLWTLATVVLAFMATMYAVALSMIQKMFWNCMNTKDIARFPSLISLYAAAVVVGPIVISLFEWVKERLSLMWRRVLTEHLLQRYFADINYYKLTLTDNDLDNPDQRISEDVLKFTSRAVRFITIMGVALFDVVIFSVILHGVYAPLLYTLHIYSVIGTLAITLAGRQLLTLNRMQAMREGNFRFGLVRVREATESIAFYRGEQAEKNEITSRLASAVRNNINLLGLRRDVQFLSTSFKYWAQVVPTIVIGPQYFAGKVQLGTLSQVYFSFNHVLSSLGLVVTEFVALAEFAAGIRRLKGIADALTLPSTAVSDSKITSTVQEDDDYQSLELSSLTVLTPSNPPRTLVQDLDLKVESGERLVVVGRSGIGKSSLMRAICGLWTNGNGEITRPSTVNTLFLPQKPFIMLGSLRENVLYPSQRSDISDADVNEVLRRVNLGYLTERMGGLNAVGETLSRRMSLGEQQRLAFARVLVAKPKFVILDESTSALDPGNEYDMYGLIKEAGITCVSVGNRTSLLDFHDRVLRLEQGGKWRVESIESARTVGISS